MDLTWIYIAEYVPSKPEVYPTGIVSTVLGASAPFTEEELLLYCWHQHVKMLPQMLNYWNFNLSIYKVCVNRIKTAARNVKLGIHTSYDKRMTLLAFQCHGSKVNVKCDTLLNLVYKIKTEPFQLGPSNLVHILLVRNVQQL